MTTILFELGTEKLPPKSLKTLRDALSDHVRQSLIDANISFDRIKSFAARAAWRYKFMVSAKNSQTKLSKILPQSRL